MVTHSGHYTVTSFVSLTCNNLMATSSLSCTCASPHSCTYICTHHRVTSSISCTCTYHTVTVSLSCTCPSPHSCTYICTHHTAASSSHQAPSGLCPGSFEATASHPEACQEGSHIASPLGCCSHVGHLWIPIKKTMKYRRITCHPISTYSYLNFCFTSGHFANN